MKVKLSRYHIGVLVLYIFVIPLCFVLFPTQLRYAPTSDNLGFVTGALVLAVLSFLYFVWPRNFQLAHPSGARVLMASLYGLLFAIPEEIIFRGVVQGYFLTQYVNGAAIVLFSALFFGAAHLPNGARGVSPRDWNWKFFWLSSVAGLPLGLLFLLTKSLLIPTLLHTFFLAGLKLFRNSNLETGHPSEA